MVELLASTWPQKDIYKVWRGNLGKEGSARLFPDPWNLCVLSNAVFTLHRHGHHGCVNACRSSSIQWLWGLLDPSRIPPGSHGSSWSCRAMQCPAAETPPADFQLKKAHQLCITSSRYCPILPFFPISKYFAGFVIRQEQCKELGLMILTANCFWKKYWRIWEFAWFDAGWGSEK